MQRRNFANVFNAIRNGQKNGLKKQLGLRMDKFNVIRCHGQFLNADLSEEAKYPKLLPRQEYFTKFLIQEVHGKCRSFTYIILFKPGVSDTS